MSEKRIDRRVGKTRDALASALFVLIQRDDWSAITIQSICDEANVARASFYAHFDSKVDLLDFMLERNLGSLAQQVAAVGGGGIELLRWFVEHVTSSRSRFAKIVLTPDAHPALLRFKTLVTDQFAKALELEGLDVDRSEVTFIMGGTMDMIMNWSKTWRMERAPKLVEDVSRMAKKILERG